MKEQLSVISKSKSMVKSVYELCKELPKEEKYALIPQMCRAAISVPSNLAEGQQRTDKEFIRFISIARGSLFELKVQVEICQELYGMQLSDLLQSIDEIGKMTYGLTLKLKSGG